jgi:hypothetical protein
MSLAFTRLRSLGSSDTVQAQLATSSTLGRVGLQACLDGRPCTSPADLAMAIRGCTSVVHPRCRNLRGHRDLYRRRYGQPL